MLKALLLPFIFFLITATGAMSTEQDIFILGGNMATAIAFGPAFLLLYAFVSIFLVQMKLDWRAIL